MTCVGSPGGNQEPSSRAIATVAGFLWKAVMAAATAFASDVAETLPRRHVEPPRRDARVWHWYSWGDSDATLLRRVQELLRLGDRPDDTDGGFGQRFDLAEQIGQAIVLLHHVGSDGIRGGGVRPPW